MTYSRNYIGQLFLATAIVALIAWSSHDTHGQLASPEAAAKPGQMLWRIGGGNTVNVVSNETQRLLSLAAKLEQQTLRHVNFYGNNEDLEKRAELKQQLEQTISEHFDIKQKLRALELQRLEARLKRLRDLHDKRTLSKATIVQDRMEYLLREADGLGWGSSYKNGWPLSKLSSESYPVPMSTRPGIPGPVSRPTEDDH